MVNAQEWLENLINLESQEKISTKEERAGTRELFIKEQLEGVLDLTDFTNLACIYISRQVDAKQFEITNQREDTRIIADSWIDISINFAKKADNFGKTHQNKWEEKGFGYEEAKEWFDAWGGSFAPNGYDLYAWLKEEKKVDSAWVLDNIDHDNKLELFEKCAEEYGKYKSKKNYGLCPECHKTNVSSEWCQPCNAERLKKDFDKWTSGNSEIDKVIQKSQLSATNTSGLLEWVPYEQFSNIEYLAEGGFGMICKAEREKGVINKWNNNEKKWERGQNNKFVLKILKDSQNVTNDFLQEISNCQTVTQKQASPIVPCLGISQEPETSNYVMVMPYIDESDLRKFFQNHSNELEFRDKIEQLANIVIPLETIHSQNLVHKDLHPGNILVWKDRNNNNFIPFITDLGLSQPANETNQGKIYGVLPYVAPEVLKERKYTSAADIYSFSMVIYEVISELLPYYDLAHDNDLAQKICQGLRPNLDAIIAPPLLKDLIRKCWDADPLTRPTAAKLVTTLGLWIDEEINVDKYNEFARQVQETEELGKALSSQVSKSIYKIHSQAIHTSQLLDFKNLPESQNNPSQEWQTTTLLDLQIKGVKKELEIIKEPISNELAKLVDKFIEIKKRLLKDKGNEELENNAWDLEDKLEEKGLARKKIDEIIRYCEKLVELEKNQPQAQVEIPTK